MYTEIVSSHLEMYCLLKLKEELMRKVSFIFHAAEKSNMYNLLFNFTQQSTNNTQNEYKYLCICTPDDRFDQFSTNVGQGRKCIISRYCKVE